MTMSEEIEFETAASCRYRFSYNKILVSFGEVLKLALLESMKPEKNHGII
jgi:hypothetical protein